MKNAITYVGLDAHKKDIYVAMLVDHERAPVTWAAGERTERAPAVGPQARARGARPGALLL